MSVTPAFLSPRMGSSGKIGICRACGSSATVLSSFGNSGSYWRRRINKANAAMMTAGRKMNRMWRVLSIYQHCHSERSEESATNEVEESLFNCTKVATAKYIAIEELVGL